MAAQFCSILEGFFGIDAFTSLFEMAQKN